MIDIYALLNTNRDNLTEEEKEYVEEFTDKLKEKVIDELVDCEVSSMILKAKNDKEGFKEDFSQMLMYGCKGFNKMPMQTLINIYLEKKTDVDFMRLLEDIQ